MPTEPDEGYLDDEFAKFRAKRLKKGASPLEPHGTQAVQTPPKTTRPPPPPLPTRETVAAAPEAPVARDEHPTGSLRSPGRSIEVIEEPPAGDDFERFRAQRLRESGKRETARLELPVEPLEPAALPAPAPESDPATRPTVKLAEAPEDGLFFGTNGTERSQSRAHAREARAEGEVPAGGDEAA